MVKVTSPVKKPITPVKKAAIVASPIKKKKAPLPPIKSSPLKI